MLVSFPYCFISIKFQKQDWLGIADKVSRPSSILSADNWFRPSDTWGGVL
jgi:hypothetical protein